MTIRMRRLTFLHAIITIVLVVSTAHEKSEKSEDGANSASTEYNKSPQKESNFLTEGDSRRLMHSFENSVKSVPYFQASIPMRIYECIRSFDVLRCTKLYVLKKMEERKDFPKTGNVTRDFLEQFFGAEEEIGSLVSDRYIKMSDDDLNLLLVKNFRKFFTHRDIRLHFLPGVMVKIVPSKENKLTFKLKKTKNSKVHKTFSRRGRAAGAAENDEDLRIVQTDAHNINKDELRKKDGNDQSKRKNKKKSSSSYKSTIIQMAVPVMIMPAILMGTFLPFLLPMLKMATVMTMLMNNSAFIAALIYAARTHANSQEEQHISYGHPGYH